MTTVSSPSGGVAMNSGLVSASLSSASSLMALQLFSRLFTFALNQALFRLASPTAFGAAAIQLELLLSTILFLSREGVRNALLRTPQSGKSPTDDTLLKKRRSNLAFLPLLLGIPLALAASASYRQLAGHEIKAQPRFELTVAIYALAAVAELCSEPFFNVAMGELQTGVRVRAEGLGITAKSVTTFAVLYFGSADVALISFALGQLMYSLMMLTAYVVYLGFTPLLPKNVSSPAMKSTGNGLLANVDQDALHLSFTMTLQSLVKHVLTEGDKVVLSWFSPLRDQGGYAIAVNYGSLIARIIFQPIEETLRVFFSRTLGKSSTTLNAKLDEEPLAAMHQASSALRGLLSAQTSLSLIVVIFGAPYLSIVLPILLPPQYMSTSAPQVLGAWLFYIPVLAVNGALEAFLSSVASTKDLNKQSRWMIVFSTVYILFAIGLYRAGFGDASLVYANIINLSVRIVYCFLFVQRYFAAHVSSPSISLRQILPPLSLIIACLFSASVVTFNTRQRSLDKAVASLGRKALFQPEVLLHVALGGVLALMCTLVWWTTSGRYLAPSMRKSKSD